MLCIDDLVPNIFIMCTFSNIYFEDKAIDCNRCVTLLSTRFQNVLISGYRHGIKNHGIRSICANIIDIYFCCIEKRTENLYVGVKFNKVHFVDSVTKYW